MSLISDALKRQEQLRGVSGAKAPGTPREWKVESGKWKETDDCRSADGSSAYPTAVDEGVEVSDGAHLQGQHEADEPSALRQETPSISPPTRIGSGQCEADEPSVPRQKDNRRSGGPGFVPAATVKPSNRQTVKPVDGGVPATNPFLERERAAARRSNPSVLLMPVLGIIVLLVLLFLRREFVPREEVEVEPQYAPRKVEETPAEPIVLSREEGRGKREQGTANGGSPQSADDPSAGGRDEARPSQAVDEGVELSNGAPVQAQREADKPSALRQSHNFAAADGATTAAQAAPASPPSGGPTSRGDAAPNLAAPAAQPQPTTWPAFTLTGIAVGRERLAILNTGEMLLAGETSKCGVKVEKVNASTVVFAWGGETKTLRKGEHSDKPAD